MVEAPQNFIAGLVAEATGSMTSEMSEALEQRKALIERRAAALAEAAVDSRPAWLQRLGDPPLTVASRRAWLAAVTTVAAYRDRHQITSDLPLGPGARTEAERADRAQAVTAQRRAAALASSMPAQSDQPFTAQSILR